MSDTPLLGAPTWIGTHPDGRFSVQFYWERAPDTLWIKAIGDLMRRSGREAIALDENTVTVSFLPQDAEHALDDLAALLQDAEKPLDSLAALIEAADRHYATELEQRESAIRFVRESLLERYGTGPDL